MGDLLGLDIGGTKCAVIRADSGGRVTDKVEFPTTTPAATLGRLLDEAERLAGTTGDRPDAGVACGGPLDEPAGLILSPPNLPGWDRVPIVAMLRERLGGRAWLMNDANAGALAEWQFGAGRGCANMVFLTAGTGMGAGLILGGRLYEGTSGNAGEVGHIRLADDGPVGYGKRGSFEGFCSGGGIAQLARRRAEQLGGRVAFNPGAIEHITARDVGLAAEAGDAEAIAVLHEAGRWLGRALAVIVDILNPERIVLGSLYVRCGRFLEPAMRAALEAEALAQSVRDCRILPAGLGEKIGDHAAVAVALYRRRQLCAGEPAGAPNPEPKDPHAR